MNAHDIIIRPIISEKSMDQLADKKYTFEVKKSATKVQIRQAVEEIFNVKVVSVTTSVVLGKVKRMGATSGKRADWKKATVKLSADSKTIEFFEGLA
ncbi:MAG: 50S ribosomal protein L23 [Ruminococcaceae bacterium]|nr:50S ribosomal protein L23 [Oscillospiraceae bacterium]